VCLRLGGNPRAKDTEGWTPLHRAAANCHAASIEALVHGGASGRDLDVDRYSPLYVLAMNVSSSAEIAYAALAAILRCTDNDFTAKDKHGRTAEAVAREQGANKFKFADKIVEVFAGCLLRLPPLTPSSCCFV